jgi:hypothetical protein
MKKILERYKLGYAQSKFFKEYIQKAMFKCYETVEFRQCVSKVNELYKVREKLEFFLEEKTDLSKQAETILNTIQTVNSLNTELDINNYQYFRDIVSSEL